MAEIRRPRSEGEVGVKKPGQVALVPFPQVDLTPGKPRPVLLLAREDRLRLVHMGLADWIQGAL
jgi:hypothetical protein